MVVGGLWLHVRTQPCGGPGFHIHVTSVPLLSCFGHCPAAPNLLLFALIARRGKP